MAEKNSNNNSEQQNNVTELEKYRKTFNGDILVDCVKNLLEHYEKDVKSRDPIHKTPKELSEILHDFIIAFLVNTTLPQKENDKTDKEKDRNKEKSNDKYAYFIPETFLCWALFEYAHYKNQKTLQFVNETLNGNVLDLKSEIEEDEERRKLIQIHYDAYKHLAGNRAKEICEHLQTFYLKNEQQ